MFETVKQVGLGLAQVVIQEGAVDEDQGCPIEAVSESVGQVGLQQVGGFAGVGEDGPEELVMGLVDFVGHDWAFLSYESPVVTIRLYNTDRGSQVQLFLRQQACLLTVDNLYCELLLAFSDLHID